jgi:hypothetical protein
MVRYACAAVLVAGLTGCFREEVPIPEPVPVKQECPTLGEQIPAEIYAPVRTLGRREVSARGGLTRHLWLVFLEQEEELNYCNAKLDRLRDKVEQE